MPPKTLPKNPSLFSRINTRDRPLWIFLWALACQSVVAGNEAYLKSWPQWRGPLASGVAPRANPPIRWSETNNISWKIPLPGKGHSSPIIFGDAVFLMAAVPVGEAHKPVYDD